MNNNNNNNMMMSSEEECSSGCDSGWTMYLDHSSNTYTRFMNQPINEEDDDQSMLSDASSGPPHFKQVEDDDHQQHIRDSYAKSEKKTKKKIKQGMRKHLPFANLDDTASSSIHNFTQPEITPIHKVSNASSSHLKKKTGFGNHFGNFKSSASAKGTTGGLNGEKWD